MAAPFAGRSFLDDPSKQSSPAARPPRNPATEPTSPPSVATEQPATCPLGDSAAAAATEDAYAETTQHLSKLNVDAVVFSPQATLQTTVLNVGAAEFRPQTFALQFGGSGEPQPDSYSFPTDDAVAAEGTYEESEACGVDTENNDMEVMLRANETLAELARAPARFEHLASLLIADISPLVGASEQALQNLADVIVDYAESSPNVSYTCAQLCSHLNVSGIGGSPDAFRRCLLQKCSKSSKKLQSAHDSAERRWFTTFLAELFVAITIMLDSASGGVSRDPEAQPIKSAALFKGVKKLLMALLGGGGATEEPQPSDDDLKCVAQVLKLCGWELASFELDNHSTSSSATSLASTSTASVTSSASASSSSGVPSSSVSDVLKVLRSRRDRAGLSCQRLIDSVLKLEESGWGRSQSATDIATPAPATVHAAATPTEQRYQQLQFQCEPVFYSHDGREITRREAGFADFEDDEFQSYAYGFGGSVGQDYASGGGDINDGSTVYFDDLELDDEICEAYEAFCQQNATASRDQQYQSKSS